MLKVEPVRVRREPDRRQRPVVDGQDERVHCRDDRAATHTDTEPSRAEPEDRGDQERLRDPVRPIGIVLPEQTMTDSGVGEDRQQRDQRGEASQLSRVPQAVATSGVSRHHCRAFTS